MTSNDNKEKPKTTPSQPNATDERKKANGNTDNNDEKKDEDFLESLDTKFPLSGGETDEDIDL